MRIPARSTIHSAFAKPVSPASGGYIALISVIILGAIGISVTSSLLLLGIGSSQASLLVQQQTEAKSMSDYCAEVALLNLHNNLNYYGGDLLTYNDAQCQIITVLGKGNRNRTIETTGWAGSANSKIKIVIDRVRPQIVLTSWQEVADF